MISSGGISLPNIHPAGLNSTWHVGESHLPGTIQSLTVAEEGQLGKSYKFCHSTGAM